MASGNYAQTEQWYREHPDPSRDATVCMGLGLSAAEFAAVKIEAAEKADLILPIEYKGFRLADIRKRIDITNKVARHLPQIDRTKAPSDWFELAAVRIAKTARSTVERQDRRKPKPQSADTFEQNRSSSRERSSSRDDSNKKASQTTTSHTREPLDGQGREGKRKRSEPVHHAADDKSPPSKSARRDWPPIVAGKGGDNAVYMIETGHIIRNDSRLPSFDLFKAELSKVEESFAQATYKGQWNKYQVVIQNDITLQRVVDYAVKEGFEQIEINVDVQPPSNYQFSGSSYRGLGQSFRDGSARRQHSADLPIRLSQSPSIGLHRPVRNTTSYSVNNALDNGKGGAIQSIEHDKPEKKNDDVGMSDHTLTQDTTSSSVNTVQDNDEGGAIQSIEHDKPESKNDDVRMSDQDASNDLYSEPGPSPVRDQCTPAINDRRNANSRGVSQEPDSRLPSTQVDHASTSKLSTPVGDKGPQQQNGDNTQITKSAEDGADGKGSLSDLNSYQLGPVNQYQAGETELKKINSLAEEEIDMGEETGDIEEREALYMKYQNEINQSLQSQLARQTLEAIRGLCSRFNLRESSFTSSSDRIPIDRRWMLNPGAALAPHQWQLVDEMLQQEVRLGGGIVGDPPGVGKTHPTLFKAYVNFFILRLRYQVKVDRDLQLTNRHIITEAHLQQASETCPSQPNLPIPCPCKVGNWTHSHDIPKGAALYITMPNIMKTTLRAIQNLFDNAPIFNVDPVNDIPFRVAIAHGETQSDSKREKQHNPNLIDHYTKPLDNHELSQLCRPMDWTHIRETIPSNATKIHLPSFPPCLTIPPGQTGVSVHACRYLIVTTTGSLSGQLLNKTIVNAVWKERKKKNGGGDMSNGPHYLLVLREMHVDEGHNNFNSSNNTMRTLQQYRFQLKEYTQQYMRYWMGSGTARQGGLTVPVNHIASMISRESWWTTSEDTENGFLTPERKEWLSRLCFESPTRVADKDRPFKKLLNDWNELTRNAQLTMSGTQVNSSQGEEHEKLQEKFKDYIDISAKIFKEFLIERSHDTLRIDGSQLLPTANIKAKSMVRAVRYSQKDVDYIRQLSNEVKAQMRYNLGERVAKWERTGRKGPKPVRINTWKIEGYHELIVASTAPSLVRLFKNSPKSLGNVQGLQSEHTKQWWDNPLGCPLYQHFNHIILGDKKWHELNEIIKMVWSKPKSTGSKSKLLIGLRLPTLALLYYCGLLKKMNQNEATSNNQTEISKRPVTAIHSGINLPDRMPHFDAFNDDQSATQFLITPIELVAEGVTLTGANFVVVVDPHPKIDKTIQFCGRPCRHGQTESVVYVGQLYNEDSIIDTQIIRRQIHTQNIISEVSKVDIRGADDGKGKKVDGQDEDEMQITGSRVLHPHQRTHNDEEYV